MFGISARPTQAALGSGYTCYRCAKRGANVSSWHDSDLLGCPLNVRYRGLFGRQMLAAKISLFDPGCVKTHTSAKCIKYNSPTRHRSVYAQYDLTLRRAIPSRLFYARGERWSFYTAKTHMRHRESCQRRTFAGPRRRAPLPCSSRKVYATAGRGTAGPPHLADIRMPDGDSITLAGLLFVSPLQAAPDRLAGEAGPNL
jgi:hypothetical protein